MKLLNINSKFGNVEKLRNDKTFVSKKYSKFDTSSEKNIEDIYSGTIFGKLENKNELLIMPNNSTIVNKNTLVVGSTGSGKTASYIIPNIINNKVNSIVVIDSNGEVKQKTEEIKKEQGYKIYDINFNDINYNPLYYVQNKFQAKKLAIFMINSLNADTKSSFFKDSAINFLTAIIMYVKTEYDREEVNMRKVIDVYNEYVQDEENFNNWIDTFDKSHPAYDYLSKSKCFEITGVTRLVITNIIENVLNTFNFEINEENISSSNCKFDDLVNEQSILYINIPNIDNNITPLVSVLVNQMLISLYDIKAGNVSHNNRNVDIYLDNFMQLGKVDEYSKILGTSRSVGLTLHTVIQDVSQLVKSNSYSEEEISAIFNNIDCKLLLDFNDSYTIRYLANNFNNNQNIGNDLLYLKPEKSVLFVNSYKPLKLVKVFKESIYPNL